MNAFKEIGSRKQMIRRVGDINMPCVDGFPVWNRSHSFPTSDPQILVISYVALLFSSLFPLLVPL